MSVDSLWGVTATPQLHFPARPLMGYLLLFIYLFLTAYLLWQDRRDLLRLSPRRWFALLALGVVGLALSQFLPFTWLAAAGSPVRFAPFLLAPIFLAGALFGPGAALLVGLVAGLGRVFWDPHIIFEPFYFALVGWLAAVWIRQNYAGRIYGWLRRPVVAGVLSAVVPAGLLGLHAYAYVAAPAGVLVALDQALIAVVANLLPLALAGLLGGLAVAVIQRGVPDWQNGQGELLPSPQARSLRLRLFTGFALLMATVGLLMAALVFAVTVNASRQLLIDQMALTARAVSNDVPAFQEQLQSLLVAADGGLLSDDPAEIEQWLRQLFTSTDGYRGLLLVDTADGLIQAYPETAGNEPTLSPAEQENLAGIGGDGQAIVTYTAGTDEVSVLVPVPGSDSRVLVGRLPGVAVEDLILGLPAAQGSVFIVDQGGQIVAHSDQPSRLATWEPDTAAKRFPARADVGGQVYEDHNEDSGARELVYYLPGEEHPWTVVVTLPYEVMLGVAVRMGGPLLLVLLLLIGGLAAGLVYTTHSITAPLQSLVGASQRIAAGELDTPVEVMGDDEIGQLGHAFESMRASLKNQIDEVSLLLQTSQAVSASINIQEGMPAILTGALQGTAAAGARAVVVNPSGRYPLTFGLGPLAEEMTSFDRYITSAVRSKEMLLLHTPTQVRRALELTETVPLPFRALIALSLYTQGRFQGVFWLGYTQPHPFTPKEVELLRTLAGQASVLVETARLFANAEGGRRRLAAVLASTADAVIVTDQTERILLINPAMERLFNLKAGAMIGRPVMSAIQAQPLLEALLGEGERPRSAELTLDGRTLYVNASTIYSNDNQVLGRVAVLHDISHLKELDEMKSEFVATVSHDLRGPLTFMRGYVTMLSMVGDVNPQQQSYIEKIMIGIRQMSTLVEELLDLGRLEAGVEVVSEAFSPRTLLERVVKEQQEPAQAGGLRLRVQTPADLPLVVGDMALIERAVSNLVGNAIKYAPNSGVVTLRAVQDAGEVVFSVQDNGPGIAKQDQIRLFEKFYQVKRRGGGSGDKGSGLGLSIVKTIAQRHGGRVWCDSQPGKGSIFFFTLPLNGQQPPSSLQ